MVVLLLVLPVRVVLVGGSRNSFFLLLLMLYRCNLFFFFISLPVLSVVIFRVDVAVAAVGDAVVTDDGGIAAASNPAHVRATKA